MCRSCRSCRHERRLPCCQDGRKRLILCSWHAIEPNPRLEKQNFVNHPIHKSFRYDIMKLKNLEYRHGFGVNITETKNVILPYAFQLSF